MLPKVSSVYRVGLQKNDHRQSKDGNKKKETSQFKEVLDQVLTNKKT